MAPSDRSPIHILVIRFSALGDVAMTVPVLRALLQQHPEVHITVLTRGFFKPLFSQLENVTVFEADLKGKHKGPFGLWKLYTELKARGLDGVADLHNVLRTNVLRYYFQLGGIPFFQLDKARRDKKVLTALKNKVFKPLKSTHQRYADVFAEMDLPLDLSKVSLYSKEKLFDSILKHIGREPKKWVGIAPFAAHEGKMYPLALMKKVIELLGSTQRYKLLLFGGGKKEQAALENLAETDSNCIVIAEKLSLHEELALISNLDLMLSMDSANGHLAAMYDIPVVTLWGVTHPYAGFAPFGQDLNNSLLADRTKYPLIPTSIYGNKIPRGYETVMETISAEAVVTKIKEVLGD
ncbi:glycosyltransferase family 9 protein [Maribacter halichondriae]|uniref:glycosyltransferase family 9 protein n=1 Tax=Maribacter halichondriae TaxID=2980554 RepID=UPI00235833AA|nr:glycosyltransferase family 9 protein [Maribacter sp. Hal144]